MSQPNNGQFRPTHGHTSSRSGKVVMSPTYHSWNRMKDRVLNPNHVAYRSYGGRGITICQRWLAFENFLADMGQRPTGTSLERRENSGNYEPGNCYWATPKQQGRNKRTNLILNFQGLSLPACEWAERFSLPRYIVYGRIKAGWTVEATLLTGVDMRFSHRRQNAIR